MLLGRDREQALLDAVLESARRGVSRALVIRGEPGMGKTALLRYAEERAHGMGVVGATGVEAESEVPFAGLAELLHPLLARLDVIPPPQRAALESALALGPPTPADPFAVSAGTLSLLAAAADDAPLLAIVDDAHWLDAASARGILFAARRLERDGVGLLFAVRTGVSSPFEGAGLPELVLPGLDEASSRALLARSGRDLTPDLERTIVATAGGNPLALLEIPPLLTEAELRGSRPSVAPLRVGEALERAFVRELETLAEPARRALLVAAAEESGETAAIVDAIGILGDDPASLDDAQARGIVTVGDEVRFRHPLLRAVAYHRPPRDVRRSAHRALALALGRNGRASGRAWHLALGAVGADDEAAAALADAAVDARLRTGAAAAASAFERSARLTTDTDLRARRLVEAARDWVLAGRVDRATQLLEEAHPLASEPGLRVEIDELRARSEFLVGALPVAHSLLVDAAARVESVDPGKAVALLTQAAVFRMGAGEPRVALELAERAARLAERAGDGARLVAGLRMTEVLFVLGERERAESMFEPLITAVEGADPIGPIHLSQGPALMLIYLERYAEGRQMVMRSIAAARRASAPTMLPLAMGVLSLVEFRTGNWHAARAAGSEAVRLADETGQVNLLLYPLSILARVDAAQGRVDECRSGASRALELTAGGLTSSLHWGRAPLGFLALSLGDYDEAIRQLEPIARDAAETGLGNPAFTQWPPDLVEAYARSGRTHEAEEALDDLEGQAAKTQLAWVHAAAARCRGLLAADRDFEPELARALAWHERTPTPFERARTQLVLGERRRRAGRRVEARKSLRAALDTFERLGAHPWTTRARAELQATGERTRQRTATADEELTAQEVQVALAIASGATNREAAAALFLSPKTIEYHLTHIYGKLGLRSRSELARRFARELAPAPG